MKKILIGVLISTLLGLPVFALSAYNDEQYLDWSNFCPLKYVNSTYQQESKLAYVVGILLTASIIGMPVGVPLIQKEQAKKEGNYWLLRRRNFMDSISICNDIQNSDERKKCHLKVRELEDNLNNKQNINVYANPSPVFVFW
jgi:hypothetical protein